jgi:hypothetical protein
MSDQVESTAFNEAAPAAERTEALSQLQQQHMPTQVDPAVSANVSRILQEAVFQFDQPEFDMPMAKSLGADAVNIISAQRAKKRGIQSVTLDDWTINVQGEYWERPSALSFDALRTMVAHTPILNAVIMTRARQVQRFCRVADKGTDAPGFEIRHADRSHKLAKSEQESIALLNRFILNCGWEFKPRLRKAYGRDSFGQFMAKSVRDTLTMDSAPIEVEWKRDQSLGIDGFYAVDGATIRLCTEHGYQGNDKIQALQLIQGQIRTAYTFNDLVYEPRNPRTDVNAAGYGLSEVELMVRVVTGYLNAMTYNIAGFDNNSIPKGMLQLSGNYDAKDVAAFRRYWNAMVKGVGNVWSLPVLVSKDQESKATFEKFGIEFNEMYFAKWMTFLTSIICALFGMSPAEINFDSFSGGNSSPLAGSDTAEKLTASKDSGLRPLLAYYENVISDFIVHEFSDNYVFRFTGLDPEDADKKHELKKLVLTIDELRAEEGYEKHPNKEMGEAPANPQLMQVYMQSIAPEEPQPMAPDGKTPLNGEGHPINEQGHKIGPDGQPLPPDGVQKVGPDGLPVDPAAPDFGGAAPDFGKSFGLPPVFDVKDM